MKKGGIFNTFFQHIFSVAMLAIAGFLLFFPTASQAVPGIITYQGKLTNASGATVSNGTYSIKVTLYDAASGGTCKYTASGTCGTPTALSVTVTNGVFSVALGGSGTNSIDPTIFQSGDLYLGLTVASDSEMIPRKQLTTNPFAYNALYLSGLATSTVGGTSSYISTANSNGNFVFTGTPQNTTVSGGVLYINPASATTNHKILGVAVGGSSRLTIDAEGDISTSGTIHSADVIPFADANSDLGSATQRWSSIWAQNIRYATGGTTLSFTATGIGVSSSTPGRAFDIAGGFMVSGSSIMGDSSADDFIVHATSTFNAGISSQSIIPLTTNTYDIGSASTFYRNVYATGTINVTNLTVTGTCTGCGSSAASGFTDGGTLIALTTITDQVGMGTSTAPNGVKLHLVNDKNDATFRITVGSSQTRDLSQWVNAASSSILARVTATGDVMSSSSLQAAYGRFYTDVTLDPNEATNYWVPLLLVGTSSAPDDATVFIKRTVSESNGRGQIMISEGTTSRRVGIGMSDTQFSTFGSGSNEGEAYITTWHQASSSRTNFGIYGRYLKLDATAQDGSDTDQSSTSTAALVLNLNTASSSRYQPATLILQKNSVDRLRIYTTSTNAVVFTANIANANGASGFVFEQATKITSSTSRGVFSVRNGGDRLMSIDAGGNVFAAGSFIANTAAGGFPGDLAEYVPITEGQNVEAGDVVVVDPQNPIKHIKSPGALQTGVAGIVSNTAAFVIGSSENGTRVPLALSGLAYAKVSDEAGAIAIGDLLVTASKPGYLMKYDPAKHTGQFAIVALAMEGMVLGEDKKILTHVRNSYSLPSQVTVSESSSGNLSISTDEAPIVQSIRGANNSWSISRDGLLVSDEIETKSLSIIDGGNSESTIGEGYFGPGEMVISVLSNKVRKDSKVFITFRTDLKGKSYYVSSITPGESFMVNLSAATEEPLVFDWWILHKKSQTLEELEEQTQEVLSENNENLPPETGNEESVPEENTGDTSTTSTPDVVITEDGGNTTSTPEVPAGSEGSSLQTDLPTTSEPEPVVESPDVQESSESTAPETTEEPPQDTNTAGTEPPVISP